MGAPGFDMMSLLNAIKGMNAGQQSLGPQSAIGDALASVNPMAGSIDPSTMQAPGVGSGAPPDPSHDPSGLAKLAHYASVMKGLQSSKDMPPRGPESSPAINIQSSANPQLSPIRRPAPGPNSVGASLATPEGRSLILALNQMNAGIPAGA